MTPTVPGQEVSWWELHHAYGPATDIPELLAALSQARGWKRRKCMTELCNRVLHQGTIYSASPPAVRQLIPMAAKAGGRDRVLFYEVLVEFAASSRKAIQDGCAIDCCAGGDPKHGSAILADLLRARDQIAPDLASPHSTLRRYAGDLLCCSADAGSEAVRMVRDRFQTESDSATRKELLDALIRVRERWVDRADFLSAAIKRESDPDIRFVLRHEQIREHGAATDPAAASDFVSMFAAASQAEFGGDCGRFFDGLERLGSERNLAGLLEALDGCANRNVALAIAERLLRLVFRDNRSGWQNSTYSVVRETPAREPGVFDSRKEFRNALTKGVVKLLFFAVLWKLFPFLLRRKLRKGMKQRHKMQYWQVMGEQPELPARLTGDQQRVLAALAEKEAAWVDQTNLWSLFGLPDRAGDLRAFLAARSV